MVMIRKKLAHVSTKSRLTVRKWKGTMRGMPCFVVGNGPSINDYPIADLLDNYFTIGINRSFKIMDTTILMWQDIELWMTERAKISKVKSIKFSRAAADPRGIAYQFKLIAGSFRLPPHPMVLFGRGSTGPLALQLAYTLGCEPIILLGYDCKYRGENTDFYGANLHHKGTTLPNCRRGLRWVKKCQEQRHIINCSDNDILDKREDLPQVISDVKKIYRGIGREYFVTKLFSRQNK